jgi:hypothetical protein
MNKYVSMGNGANFEFQHDARPQNFETDEVNGVVQGNVRSYWQDDCVFSTQRSSRGLLLDLNYWRTTSTLYTAWIPPFQNVSARMGRSRFNPIETL